MNRLPAKTGSELFIVDNSDKDWKVRNYLEQWADGNGNLKLTPRGNVKMTHPGLG